MRVLLTVPPFVRCVKENRNTMPNYKVQWTEETWYKAEVSAETIEEAYDAVLSGEYESLVELGRDIQDSIEVEIIDA
jgi:hypothetical protein